MKGRRRWSVHPILCELIADCGLVAWRQRCRHHLRPDRHSSAWQDPDRISEKVGLGGRHLGIEFQCCLIEAIESEVNDATAVHFGALAGILMPFFASQRRERTAQFENLTAYVDRMMLQYFPEFSWKSQREAA